MFNLRCEGCIKIVEGCAMEFYWKDEMGQVRRPLNLPVSILIPTLAICPRIVANTISRDNDCDSATGA